MTLAQRTVSKAMALAQALSGVHVGLVKLLIAVLAIFGTAFLLREVRQFTELFKSAPPSPTKVEVIVGAVCASGSDSSIPSPIPNDKGDSSPMKEKKDKVEEKKERTSRQRPPAVVKVSGDDARCLHVLMATTMNQHGFIAKCSKCPRVLYQPWGLAEKEVPIRDRTLL